MTPELEPLTPLEQLTARLDRAEARQQRAERRARLSWACALSALALSVLLNVRPAALTQSADNGWSGGAYHTP